MGMLYEYEDPYEDEEEDLDIDWSEIHDYTWEDDDE